MAAYLIADVDDLLEQFLERGISIDIQKWPSACVVARPWQPVWPGQMG